MKAETVEVDEALFEVLAVFSAAADQVKAQWLVIGATARIMLLGEIVWDTHFYLILTLLIRLKSKVNQACVT